MKIDILTLHPDMFAPLQHSIIGRAGEKELVDINLVNIRDFGLGRYKQVDDTPYGGGAGMVMRADVVYAAIQSVRQEDSKVILMDPVGQPFQQGIAVDLSQESHLIFVCGHYEGIDVRIRDHVADMVISIGDFVLTGGELAAMVIIDATVRLLDGVLGNRDSLTLESFENGLLEAPVYTRPAEFLGHGIPDVLLSGHHKNIEEFRQEEALSLTQRNRPDLLKKY